MPIFGLKNPGAALAVAFPDKKNAQNGDYYVFDDNDGQGIRIADTPWNMPIPLPGTQQEIDVLIDANESKLDDIEARNDPAWPTRHEMLEALVDKTAQDVANLKSRRANARANANWKQKYHTP